LCVTLVIYQESLHDVRSTKYKINYKFHAQANSNKNALKKSILGVHAPLSL